MSATVPVGGLRHVPWDARLSAGNKHLTTVCLFADAPYPPLVPSSRSRPLLALPPPDFSSRWYVGGDTLRHTRTTQVG